MEQKTHRKIYALMTSLFVMAVIFGFYQYKISQKLKQTVENQYNRAFHELVNYVDDIDVLLHKGMLVSSPSQMATISSELFRQTSAAKACLGQLPISEVQMENTEKFLSQIGDYTYLLSQNTINNEVITEEDYQNLSSLGEYSSNLSAQLMKLEEEVYAGNLHFDAMQKQSELSVAQAAGGDMLSGFQDVEKEFQEYPSLIYDGPFSEHIETLNPVFLEGKKIISQADALKKAKQFLGTENVTSSGESQNTVLDTYSFCTSENGRETCLSLSKAGGYPLYYLINREIGEETISVEDAIAKAGAYLENLGFSSMKHSYYDCSGGVACVNFAYEQDGTLCYSDLIKVKVALDNGEIVGLETKGYLMAHQKRTLPAAKLTAEDARGKINSHLQIDSLKLTLIPKDSKREVLCYECHGSFSGKNYLIYINAENGREEKILMLLESENGILTI